MSEAVLYFSVCFHSDEREYLNGRGSGSSVYMKLKPGGVLNAILYQGHMDPKG